MIDPADPFGLEALLPSIGLVASDVPNVLAAARMSRAMLVSARAALANRENAVGAAFALGSLGRGELGPGSDLDLAYLYDETSVDAKTAQADRVTCIDLLRIAGFVVPSKTFSLAMPIGALMSNVGGANDSNVNLTHRALVLTEGKWLTREDLAADFVDELFGVYRGGAARGRFMSSLLNDLHRYYRTVCVDYRYKIDEADKDWATRNVKLRHARKTWHLSNLVLHCAARAIGAQGHDAFLASHLQLPPLAKIAAGLGELGAAGGCAELWRRYDDFLGWMSRPDTRHALETLAPQDEGSSPEFRALKQNADALESAAEDVVQVLLANDITRGHLLRFGLL